MLWAAGFCWFAYDVATSAKRQGNEANGVAMADQVGSGDTFGAKDVEAFAANLNSLN